MKQQTFTVDEESYTLSEMTAKAYQDTVDLIEEKFGEDWQKKSGIGVGIILLTASLVKPDGSGYTEEELWQFPIRVISKLSTHVMELNGMAKPGGSEKN